ncbi:3'(2'),5'-bisphosphate nucleotidase CysQ [Polymorphum gilvum]|uniref:Inositol monophosphatase family protein n=1 Tax=Polymorphum gilvum (strain LMG 25793 / CGMCC 1.9160 / SL003B-26A1) TaxID=991905 RepID=F2IZZ9_POLGS|nr:3'(2'),5'-bisphosphate nucleotidase CysQ [Polymorphum gilvum]ADZ71834.1 Inositol monophosphatase family protein [Polymorphum gilvum SL003B-26A1]
MPATETGGSGELELIEEAARRAGAIALEYFGDDPRTWLKEGSSPVSEADMAVDGFLAETLLTARPGYGWLSEETADDHARLDKRRVFIVDPIDGTRAFLAGADEWTVVIAVIEDERPIASAVYNPVREEMFLAADGAGAWLNGERLAVSAHATLKGARLVGPHSIIDDSRAGAAGFIPSGVIRSLAYRLAFVAAGRAEAAAARARAHDWDLAAADLLVQEAGGRLTDLAGQGLRYNRRAIRHPELAASSEALIDPVCRAIAAIVGPKT